MKYRNRTGLLFLMPGVIWVLCFTVYPLFYSLRLSFTDKRMGRGNRPGEYIGFQNYSDIFEDERVAEVMEMTLFIVFASVLTTIILGTL
ncbi:MAG: sugar ABC transporter permease, partial [Anaerolineales bacterium]|nr:sugar ABC transporter permease [Anaerolineales bacterium]